MIRRLLVAVMAAVASTAAVLLLTGAPAAAHNCGSLLDCLPSGRSLLIALAAVLIIAGLVILLSAFPPAGALALAGGGVVGSAGAISLSTVAAGTLSVTAGVALMAAAEGMPTGGSGGPGGSGSGGSGSGSGGGPTPPAQPPNVSDPRLGNIVRDLYKGTTNPNRVGNGTTMDAIRHELASGQATHGRMHAQKGREYANALRNWLRRNPNASAGDRNAAQRLLDDLLDALAGN